MLELSLNILDIVQNSISADAKNIEIIIKLIQDNLIIEINDDGKGMDEKTLENVQNPFFTGRKTRKVGLGIPFFKQAAELSSGYLEIESEINKGTKVKAVFDTKDIDCMPVGDIWDTVGILVQLNPNVEFIYKVASENEEFIFDTKAIKEYLETDDLSNFEIIEWTKEYIKENQFTVLKRSI